MVMNSGIGKCYRVLTALNNSKLIYIFVFFISIILISIVIGLHKAQGVTKSKASGNPLTCSAILRIANMTETDFRMSTVGCSYISPRGNVSLEYLVPQKSCCYKNDQIKFLKDVANHNYLNFTGPVLFMTDDDGTLSCETEKAVYDRGGIVFSHSHLKTGFHCDEKYVVFQPDFHFIEHEGFAKTIRNVRNISTPYFDRIPKVFWRGVTTGWAPQNNNCYDLLRVRLCARSRSVSWVDAKITRCVQICSNGDSCKRIEHLRGDHKKESDWVKYRGILDVDGNVNAWGLFWRLASGSVVFRVESEFTNFYTQQMVPWQHYIPISRNLSDLEAVTKLVTLKSSSRRVRRRKEGSVRGKEAVDYQRIRQEPRFLESITKNALDFTQRFTYDKVVERVVDQLNAIQLRRVVGYEMFRVE